MERTTKFYRKLFGLKETKCRGMADTVLDDNKQYFIVTTKFGHGDECSLSFLEQIIAVTIGLFLFAGDI
jgi:hypothetical protein